MRWSGLLILAFATIGSCVHPVSARAQEFRSLDEIPGMIDQAANQIIIANIGTSALNISYTNGNGVQIPSGQYVTLPSQGDGLSVFFHDGVESKSVTLSRGAIYALYWNSGLNRWAIAPYDDVARRPSVFRSRG